MSQQDHAWCVLHLDGRIVTATDLGGYYRVHQGTHNPPRVVRYADAQSATHLSACWTNYEALALLHNHRQFKESKR